jgi:indole-3-glycerol phosphate synthase
MDRLAAILEQKKAEVARLLPRMEHLRAAALLRNDFRSFKTALDGPGLAVIAEIKKSSPSAGEIVSAFNPVATALVYEKGGASAVSVLTDEQFFGGNLSHLTKVRAAIDLPVLRKDFIVHEVQIYEAVCASADAVLLIVAALEQTELASFYEIATKLQLNVLVEVHTLEEVHRALDLDAEIIGINNRNLATFEVDLATTELLSEEVPDGILLVSESGIKTPADARRVFDAGVNAILVGEALMRSADPATAIAELREVG